MPTRDVYVYVHLQGGFVPAGLLRMRVEGSRLVSSSFRYGAHYLKRPDALPLDVRSLPLRDETFRIDDRFDLFTGIKDSLPDAWGRAVMERRAERPLREDEILLASPDTRVGALAFGLTLNGPARILPWDADLEAMDRVKLEAAVQAYEDYARGDLESFDEAIRRLVLPGSSVGGARPKATVVVNDALWIAKFSQASDAFDYPRAEYASMQLAARCGVRVPSVDHRAFGERSAFLIERFDRFGDQRLHLNSMLTVLGETELSFFHSSYMDMADACLQHVRDHKAARKELFRRMIFNGLISNEDDHLRNHALITSVEDGAFELSPAYDLVPNPGAGSPLRLSVGCGLDENGRVSRTFSVEAALRASSRFGLEPGEARFVVEEVRAGLSGWEEVFLSTGMSRLDVDVFGRAFVRARAEF
ncbi:MAG: HipA domain-containing protein [Myxococcota bacterium]